MKRYASTASRIMLTIFLAAALLVFARTELAAALAAAPDTGKNGTVSGAAVAGVSERPAIAYRCGFDRSLTDRSEPMQGERYEPWGSGVASSSQRGLNEGGNRASQRGGSPLITVFAFASFIALLVAWQICVGSATGRRALSAALREETSQGMDVPVRQAEPQPAAPKHDKRTRKAG